MLYEVITDNGIGREKSKGRTAGTGTGLKVLLQTIRLLNSHNKLPISFNVEDKAPQGTIVTIEIPFVITSYSIHYTKLYDLTGVHIILNIATSSKTRGIIECTYN